MRSSTAVLVLGLLCSEGLKEYAAQEPPTRSATIVGEVRASASEPVRRANVCALGQRRRALACVLADSAGAFRIDSLYPDSYTLLIECETNSPRYSKALAQYPLEAEAHRVATAQIQVVPTGCAQRPLEVVRGELAGHWASGFELDDFVPCHDSTKHAWVERRGLRPGEVWELPAGQAYEGGTRWFVRWRGALIGPRGFTTRYRMIVEDVLEMRMPRPDDCKP